MGSRFVDGLKLKSTSRQPATGGQGSPLRHQRRSPSTASARSRTRVPTQPLTWADVVRQAGSQTTS